MSKCIPSCLILATTLFPPGTQAEESNISFYGVASLSYDWIDTGTSPGGAQGITQTKVSSNASRFGMKGAEYFGNGLSAIWQIESLIQMDNTGGGFATRNSYVRLDSRTYGSVLLGRYDTPYKAITRRLDNFADTIADNRSLFGTVSGVSASKSFVTKQPDVLAFTSPDIGGLVASVAHVNLSENATNAADKTASASSLSIAYHNDSLYGALGFESHALDTVRSDAKEIAWNAAVMYQAQHYSFALAYEQTRDSLGGATTPAICAAQPAGADCLGHSTWYASGTYLLEDSAIKAAYTRVNNLGSTAESGAHQLSIGYNYSLGKRSTFYAIYTRLVNRARANYGLGSTSYTSGATPSIGAGSTLSALSFGIRQQF